MSRTKRSLPIWLRQASQFDRTWKGIAEADGKEYNCYVDPRNALLRGRDRRNGRSYLYTNYPGKGYKEDYRGRKTRRFMKRMYAKGRRKEGKMDVLDKLSD